MGDYLKDVLTVSENYREKVRKLCRPMRDHLEIDYVAYQSIRADGSCTLVANRPEFGDFYLENKTYFCDPFIRHPKFSQSGLIIYQDNETQDPDYNAYLKKAGSDFGLNTAFSLVTRNKEEVNYFCFASNGHHPNQLSRYLKQLDLFKQFAHYFRQEGKEIFNAMEDDPVDMLPVLEHRFYQDPFAQENAENHRQQFLKIINKTDKPPLTPREKQCLQGILVGKTAKQIAQELDLSYRTVEHFIFSLRQKLNCQHKSELFCKGRKYLEEECF